MLIAAISPYKLVMKIRFVGSNEIYSIGDVKSNIDYSLTSSSMSNTSKFPLLSPINRYPLSYGP
jgi:hypothetical protein